MGDNDNADRPQEQEWLRDAAGYLGLNPDQTPTAQEARAPGDSGS